MSRSLTILGLVLAASITAAADSSADTAPKFGALPLGTVTQHPSGKAPPRIPAAEKVEGFYVAMPPKDMMEHGRADFLMVFASDQEAKDFTASKGFNGNEGTEGVCFSERVERDMFTGGDSASPSEWSVSLEPAVNIQPQFRETNSAKGEPKREFVVTAVHQERFVEAGGKASIEMTDVWVDPTTRGARLIGKASLPLTKMTTSPGGLTIYAARAGASVEFVVKKTVAPKAERRPPTSTKDFRTMRLQRMPLMVSMPNGTSDASQCSFARVALRAITGVAEMASVETPVIFETPTAAVAPPVAPKDSPLGALLGSAKEPTNEEGPEFRIRPLKISLSSTWTSKDKEPVISVSLGWAGHEHVM